MAERSGSSYASSAEDRLPWLEPVEDDETEYVVPRSRLVGGVIAALVVIAFVVGGLFWLRQPHAQASSSGEVALIPAPSGNYKTKPANPGGMKVAGEGATAYATSQGAEPNGTIDTSATPETPVKAPAATKVATAATPKAPATAAAAKPASKSTEVAIKTVPTQPAAKPGSTTAALPAANPATGGVSIQLGAFSSEAKAEAAWKSLSGRFTWLGGLSQKVIAAPKNGATVYRLRASGAGAPAMCGKLKVAGESCVVIHD